jgi:uncharacterized protein (DUF1684 family)
MRILERAVLVGLGMFLLGANPSDSFRKEVDSWRAHRLETLRAETGWLSLVGLYWLHEGENRFGSDAKNDLVLPASTPPNAGSLFLEDGKVRVVAKPGAGVTLDGAALGEHRDLKSDDQPKPDQLRVADVMFYVIRRSGRVGVRAKSPNSPARTGFRGLDYFPADEKYRVTAELVRSDKPRQIRVASIIGTTELMTVPGTLKFSLDGRELTVDPVLEGDDARELFIIFRDATAAKETYPAGRFLYADLPKDGKVVLDFNRAFNPPCAFTPYATCPVPPKQNVLPVRIEAGEKRYAGH